MTHEENMESKELEKQKEQNIKREKREKKWLGISKLLIGLYLFAMALILSYLILQLWPVATKSAQGQVKWVQTYCLLGNWYPIGNEARLLLLVMLTGALGSYIHATTSFVTYVGNRTMIISWGCWYLLRPFIGMSLALLFYFVIRGGYFSTMAESQDISPFGIAAVSGLVGLFSKQATDKLRETFDTLFKTEKGKGDDVRKDKVKSTIPVKDAMIPLNKISAYTLSGEDKEENVKLPDLNSLLKGIVTRIPVIDKDKKIKFIIHQSLIYKFIAQKSLEYHQAENKDGLTAPEELTLKQFLDENENREMVTNSIAFVKLKATLADAEQEMKKIKNCQDVIITEHGTRNEQVLGWLTNHDIAKGIKA